MPVRMHRRGEIISIKDILDLEVAVGFKLPADFKWFLLNYNGGRPENNRCTLPTDDCGCGVTNFFDIIEIIANKRQMAYRVPYNALPIADAECGNLVCIVFGERAGIYYWDHEWESEEDEEPWWENMHYLSPTFTEFWNSLEPFGPDDLELKPGQEEAKVWINPKYADLVEKWRKDS